jgi:Ca2+-binding EF-hand superfamily protein
MKYVQLVLLTLALGTLAIAAPNNAPTFEEYDSNQNGVVTQDEFDNLKTKRMTQRAEEGMPMRNAGNSPEFSDFDKDGDGQITKEELRIMQQERMNNRQQNMGKGNKSMM